MNVSIIEYISCENPSDDTGYSFVIVNILDSSITDVMDLINDDIPSANARVVTSNVFIHNITIGSEIVSNIADIQ